MISSDCFSLNMMSEPLIEKKSYAKHAVIDFKTDYFIQVNDKAIFKGTYEMDIYKTTVQPEVKFHYDALTDSIQNGSTCPVSVVDISCNGKPIDSKYHNLYNAVVGTSGASRFYDEDTLESKTFCWIMNDASLQLHDTENEQLAKWFMIQRYVLTLLHLTSKNRLFGNDEFPSESHECDWSGIECNEENIVTILSLTSEKKQIIGGTLIKEIGSLAFLEVLSLNETELVGTIPQVFSNLYSLKELDLSSNSLSGQIPEDFFNQLYRLESIDLSFNELDGVIPSNIGSESDIHTIRLNNNNFKGPLPLDSFISFKLKELDVSKNHLSGSISQSLLRHKYIGKLCFFTH